MLSGNEDVLDLSYLTAYKNATFSGNFNPETGKAYVDEVEVLFNKSAAAKGYPEDDGAAIKKVVKRTGPVVKTSRTQTLPPGSMSTTGGKKKKGKGGKKRKQQQSDTVGRSSSSGGNVKGLSARQEFMKDISNTGEVSGRRVKTVDNDYDYHQLDGTFPHLLGVVEPFDETVLTHAEMLMSGVQRGIPSVPKHRKTYIQCMVDPSVMRTMGSGFQKTVDMREGLALETRQAITAKYPEWIELRENYFRQLELKAEKVRDNIMGGIANGGGDAIRQQFLLLLLAIRKVTVRIIGEYELQCLTVQKDPHNHEARTAANDIVKYIFSIPRCFEPFNGSPFCDWVGVDFEMNPLISRTNIAGGDAVLSSSRGAEQNRTLLGSFGTLGIDTVLAMSESETEQANYVNGILHYIYRERSALGDDLTYYQGSEQRTIMKREHHQHAHDKQRTTHFAGEMKITDVNADVSDDSTEFLGGGGSSYTGRNNDGENGNDEDDDDDGTAGMGIAYNDDHEQHNNHIDRLIRQTTSSVNKALRLSRDKKLLLLGNTKMRSYWRAWRRVYRNEQAVCDSLEQRDVRNMRQCFDSFVRNQWTCVKFRGIQRRGHLRQVAQTLQAWKGYTQWARRFNDIFRRSVRHTKVKILYAMKEFAETVFENRRFQYNSDMRHYSAVFKALQRNVVLSKHELARRLKHAKKNRMVDSFIDRVVLHMLFTRWRKRNHMLHGVDNLTDLVEKTMLKDALVRWYLTAHGPKSQRNARRIAAAKGFVLSLRKSVEGTVRTSYEKVSDKVITSAKKVHRAIKGPPPPTKEEMEEMRASAEALRKSRMANALRFGREQQSERQKELVRATFFFDDVTERTWGNKEEGNKDDDDEDDDAN